MDKDFILLFLTFLGGVLTTIFGVWYQNRFRRAKIKKLAAGSGPLGKVVLNTLQLSENARKRLEQSHFIEVGKTGPALMELIESAKPNYSILAICGNKGDYSGKYYKKNFDRCSSVKRIFSFESISNEIEKKQVRYALNGLNMHMDMLNKKKPKVQIYLVPKTKSIKDTGAGIFDPAPSFGMAILCDGNNNPIRAVIHWEAEAEVLKHLISIEGIIIDSGQNELLNELMNLHRKIASSDIVLDSNNHRDAIMNSIKELENLWLTTSKEGSEQ